MLALGIVLIVLAVLFGLGVSVSSGDSTTMSVFGVDFGLSVPTLFFLGLWLMKKGLGRGYRRHKEVRQLRQKVATVPDTAEDSEVAEADGTGVTAADETPVGRHAADPVDDPDTRTVDLSAGDRLPADRNTVADGTDSKQPH
jgi:hypothetical protein